MLRFTTDFTLRIFALFYKYQHGTTEDSTAANQMIRSIQASLFSNINDYVKQFNINKNDFIEITFEKDNAIPSFVVHGEDEPTNEEYSIDKNILLHIYFKKISWNEINEFRVFFVRYMNYYLSKFHSSEYADAETISRNVSNVSYVIQELLQNANAYSSGIHDYELLFKYNGKNFDITVRNFAEENHFNTLKNILNEITSSKDHEQLLVKFMLAEDKHLGIITSIFNYNIADYSLRYIDNKIVEMHFVINIEH